MNRFLAAAAAVLALGLIGLGVLAQSGEAKTTAANSNAPMPAEGYYRGSDNHHRVITFWYDGQKIHSFHVGHHLIGGAPVNHHSSSWDRTCHDFCTNGAWLSNTQVHGAWDSGTTDHHFPWHAHWRTGN